MLIYIMQSSKATEPIKKFTSKKQFLECAKWWQNKLLLNNWIIEFELVEKNIEKDGGEPVDGYCQFAVENSEAKIVISNVETVGSIAKFSAELTVIHELLHLKREYLPENYITTKEETLDDVYLHQCQELMAKSLLMTKYNIDYKWFLGG